MNRIKIVCLASLITLVFHFLSCKKDNAGKEYYLTMNIGNSGTISFDDSVLIASKNTSVFPLEIDAFSKTNGTLRIELSDTLAVLYTEQLFSSQPNDFIFEFSLNRWIHDDGNLFIQQYALSSQVSNPISVTFTNINAHYVEGTFSGSLGDGTNTVLL